MELGLKDKVIMVAASSKGLGFGIALQAAREGAVLSIGSRTRKNIDMAAEKIKLTGVYHYFNTADETAGGFDGEYGQEIDLMATCRVCPGFDLTAASAFYFKGENNADNFTEDETVFWLRGALHF